MAAEVDEADGVDLDKEDNADDINEFGHAYKFSSNDFVIPYLKIDLEDSLDNIDLTYYMTKCREVLKKIYDNSFKKHKTY